jgi:hypothetical protein
MRLMMLLGAMWLSGAVGAERPANPPWERDWAANAGDCVALGEMPKDISCKLYSHGADGFSMTIWVYDVRQSKYFGAESFVEVAHRLCTALSTPVKVTFYVNDNKRRLTFKPPACERPVLT